MLRVPLCFEGTAFFLAAFFLDAFFLAAFFLDAFFADIQFLLRGSFNSQDYFFLGPVLVVGLGLVEPVFSVNILGLGEDWGVGFDAGLLGLFWEVMSVFPPGGSEKSVFRKKCKNK